MSSKSVIPRMCPSVQMSSRCHCKPSFISMPLSTSAGPHYLLSSHSLQSSPHYMPGTTHEVSPDTAGFQLLLQRTPHFGFAFPNNRIHPLALLRKFALAFCCLLHRLHSADVVDVVCSSAVFGPAPQQGTPSP